jgi:hypothetical protein
VLWGNCILRLRALGSFLAASSQAQKDVCFWSCQPPEQRPPIVTAKLRSRRLLTSLNFAEAQHAYDLDPWHPLVHLALAGFEKPTGAEAY